MDVAEPRRPRIAALVLGAGFALTAASPTTAADGLAIVGATVIDGTGAKALLDAVLVIENGKVRSVGPRSHALLPKGIPYLDGRGLFVVPGRLRDGKVAASLRERVRGGTAFATALAEVLRAGDTGSPSATIEPGRPADLAVLGQDPQVNLDHLSSVKRAYVAGREVAP
jgi:imidazolonepropionase-like amidohydrolase